MRRRRDEWRAGQPALDPARLVSVDETRASTNMARTHGRCPKGERLVAAAPHGHRKTATFVAAPRADGMAAPVVIGGAVTGDRLVAYAGQRLAPPPRPGDVVVMGNLACHERAGVRAAVEAAGAEPRFPPPYSPDRNPIEKAFSRLKANLRAAAKRTVAEVEHLLGTLSATFAPDECHSYFRSCGYSAATPTREPL